MLTISTKGEKTTSTPAMEQPCHRFSMSELSSATDNFDEKYCIGHGGCGKVYKGMISNGPTDIYAIKRLHFMSDQGEPEFWAEVEMLSRLRHCNLVSLIGYCNEGKDMALVYEYMHNGTLSDHLHKKGTHLTWSQRLKICIGAARGLDYLHIGTGTRHGVIHRDVKTTNILLNENYVAKIADFGLAKIGPTNQTHTYVSTKVKGTFGYMDPNYFYTGRLTRKSDVYAFGVVLLEVLCGRPALDKSLDEGLAVWAQDLIKQGKVTQIIDSRLKNHISKSSLKEFSRIVVRCLLSHPDQRPTMSEVVGSLNMALSFQEKKASSAQGGITVRKVWSLLSLKGDFELKSSERIELSLKGDFELKSSERIESKDQLPAIESLQIVGDANPGGKLQVLGFAVNKVSFLFQWIHHSPDGSIEYIKGATSPTYTVSLNDLGTHLCVHAMPVDKKGRVGKLYSCFANNGHFIGENVSVPVSSVVNEEQYDNNDSSVVNEDQYDNNDSLPSIESLQIAGDASPGGKLQVRGLTINGTVSCMFQWVRHLTEGSIEYIEGATSPTYTVALDDLGTRIGVEAMPLDKNRRPGEIYCCFANNGLLIGEC
ncbi:putative protein kinase RLK-Pelle-CrRLK1L-1 family [Helianthus annuus]|uniref:Protein kinase domain-containing protein n=2 Tax=Helianthus annuus TaxID=4232 RepID=A0A9K3HCY4_HELAN|nr:putative protein kinase RLK-Pelle-CrRLK1L-1 family [Helianthus annuus]KAJ0477832.1 putative protein kinase RLK-Pelle-CrRLK1L-1 family [Helianthus annuus]KAJ0482417.1 putative protein kinase RLK-Pelle-CrRLK1L-1 family [Helianthus annuus]KAJ0498662.1 putative protein kinase RLK-Pelle-CrRLK1L-1 family [Helianthus annuus]KAJ0664675.1 putative protein kinase RLK-Pelle-CrRLK1L-1 family [Helianthus annuus]